MAQGKVDQLTNNPIIESRTRELGLEIHRQILDHNAGISARIQDKFLVRIASDERAMRGVLGFIDTLASLDFDKSGKHTKSLYHEYVHEPLPLFLTPLTWRAATRAIPSPLFRAAVRYAVDKIATRFISPKWAIDETVTYLQRNGRYPSFDILGEAVLSKTEAIQYKEAYLNLIKDLSKRSHLSTPSDFPGLQISLKLSSLAADFNPADPEGVLNEIRPALEEIALAASKAHVALTIDAEQYEYRDLTWFLFKNVFARGQALGTWPFVGIVLQSYLQDAQQHLHEILKFASDRGTPFQVRLVKGAYWDLEKVTAEQNRWPVPVHQLKAETDLSFERLACALLLERGLVDLAVGTHNIRSHAAVESIREHLGLPIHTIEHQTLYKTWEGLSQALEKVGWIERDYAPVGELLPGMAYLVRRLLENSSQSGFLARARLSTDISNELAKPALGVTRQTTLVRSGFINTPPKRLFVESERVLFIEALHRTRRDWGGTYRLTQKLTHSEPTFSPSRSPSHVSEVVGFVETADMPQTQKAIEIANRGYIEWSRVSLVERCSILQRAGDLIAKNRDELASWVVHEGGKDWAGALADVDEAADYLHFYSEQALDNRERIEKTYVARGVVAIIPPWNFPMAIPCGMAAGALVMGNAAILKPAGPTPIVSRKLVEILHTAGVPADALIWLPGEGSTVGSALVSSPHVDMIAFTGSRSVGLGMHRTASKVRLAKGGTKKLILEMSGKNAIAILADADIDEAVKTILTSAFGHANQKCSACSRVFVQTQIYSRFVGRLKEAGASLQVGPADLPGTRINPMINEAARKRVLALAETAKRDGKLLLDRLQTNDSDAWTLGPMLVEMDFKKSFESAITQEEIFGPILPIVPFETEPDLIRAMNSTTYAMTAGIITRSPSAVRRLTSAIRAGDIYVNREITGARVGIEPFGGFQLSGTGPQAGSKEYIFAFAKRSNSQPLIDETRLSFTEASSSESVPEIEPWNAAPETRRTVLSKGFTEIMDSIGYKAETYPGFNSGTIRLALQTASIVFTQSKEITQRDFTIGLPGQANHRDWSTQRGTCLVTTSGSTPLPDILSFWFGVLLAGNGALLAPAPMHQQLCEAFVSQLVRAGVPKSALKMAPESSLKDIAGSTVAFVVADLPADLIHELYACLAETKEGELNIRALFTPQDMIRPGEDGFLRQFALPKMIAIRTMRRGADIGRSS